jgi:hypothetical protein
MWSILRARVVGWLFARINRWLTFWTADMHTERRPDRES